MNFTLRPYQQEAIGALNEYLRASAGNPAIVLPTGSGKSIVMAALLHQYMTAWPDTRVCVLAHVRELIRQNAEKLVAAWPMAPVSIYSAGLGQRNAEGNAVFASIQSVYSKGPRLGRWDLIFIDEVHRVPVTGEGMYRQFISEARAVNPHVRVVGFTATPFRLGHGLIVGGDCLLSDIAYEAHVRDLIEQGYLCRLSSRGGRARADLTGVHVRGGEYVADELEAAVSNVYLVRDAVSEIVQRCADRKAWIVFCAGVKHARLVSDELARAGVKAPVIHAKTPSDERDYLVSQYQSGTIRAICNVNVLSEGFDAPHVDAIIMLRPTKSAGLFCQQVGRGLRIHPSKSDCLVLDFAGNIVEHGPVDAIEIRTSKGNRDSTGAPMKECPECNAIIHAAARACPECGHEFPVSPAHDAVASMAPILSTEIESRAMPVENVSYTIHRKRGAPDATPSMRVEYKSGYEWISEWICVQHQGFAKSKASQWWKDACPGVPMPDDVREAVRVAQIHARKPQSIEVRPEGKFTRVVKRVYD